MGVRGSVLMVGGGTGLAVPIRMLELKQVPLILFFILLNIYNAFYSCKFT